MTDFNCLATAIGSMPHTNAAQACESITHYLKKDIPFWPQLPKRSFLEDMNVQCSQGFPGIRLTENKIFVDRSQNLDKALEELYTAFLEDDIDKYPISADYAAGLHEFLKLKNLSPVAVKGQITGPITWGMSITDNDGKAIIYDDVLGDAAAKFLKLKAAWQERELKKIAKNTITFIDEPYMVAFGSAAMPLSRERVVELLDETLSGISGIKGIHCCGNTDWSVILGAKFDILSLDAYSYAQSLSLYPKEIKRFLDSKGTIAWGIVPNDIASVDKETVNSLKDRLEEAMAPFTRNGVPFKQLLKQALITPSCSLAPLNNTEAADRVLELLSELSLKVRKTL